MNKLLKGLFFLTAFIFIAIVISPTKVQAQNAILNKISISEANKNAYNIILDTNKNVVINKKNISDNAIVLDIKNTTAVNDVEAVYQGVSNIENIVVTPKFNSVRIEIKGTGVADSNILMANGKAPLKKTNNHFLFISFLLLCLVGFVKSNLPHKKRFSVRIADDISDNSQILKVSFEKKRSLLPSGAKNLKSFYSNVQKVNFAGEYNKEYTKVKI